MARSTDGGVADEFRGSKLGDQRRERRLEGLAAAMARAPSKSFPKALPPAGLEGAYRFFSNPKVTPGAVLGGHVEQTVERMGEAGLSLVLHDSSTISFNSEGHREGLLATGAKQHFVVHCSLAVAADGSRTPLGVVAASYHLPTKSRDGRHQMRWSDHVREVDALGLGTQRIVHVMDREADDYNVLALMVSMGARFVVRLHHDRPVKADAEETEENVEAKRGATPTKRLRSHLGDAPLIAQREVKLARRGGNRGDKQRRVHPNREGRLAQLAINAMAVTIERSPTADRSTPATLRLNVVRVWEPKPPEGQPPVEWLLYTTEPIDTPEQIMQVVDWYRARWTIEEYFKALKTGCALESRQLGDLHALTNATALFLPIAWRLLCLKTEARRTPDAPATVVLDEVELEVLRAAGRVLLPPRPTVHQTMLAVAALGGHLKHNGAPGWQTLAHGFARLLSLAEGWRLRAAVESGILPPGSDQS
jgi:hypothetical protein